jgi:PHD/YefM family antitoxin component YafN of YafNO toxin-antitoxin module
MEFITVRDFSSTPKQTWKKLNRSGELVITNNGKPTAIMLSVGEGDFDETMQLIRQTRLMRLLNNIWAEAAERGGMSEEAIEAEIQEARAEMASRKGS